MQKVVDSPPDNFAPSRIESSPSKPSKQPIAITLEQLEAETGGLEVVFSELGKLKAVEDELVAALEEVIQEEKTILSDSSLSEKEGIKKLVELRAKKDLRTSRLSDHRKKIASQLDLLRYDVAEGLHARFVNFSSQLLVSKEREMSELLGRLFPPNCGLPVSLERLVRASAPVVRFRQTANWCSITLPEDQGEYLSEIRQLVPKWLEALRGVLEEAHHS